MASNAVKTTFAARMMFLHIAIGKAGSMHLGNPDLLIQTHYMKPCTGWQVANALDVYAAERLMR
jgi:hypothetical protein